MAQSPATQLQQFALEIGNDILERAQRRKSELADLKLKQMQIETQLESADLCFKRSRNFRTEIGGDLQCARCWILNETEVAMSAISSDTQNDSYRCPRCQDVIEIEMP